MCNSVFRKLNITPPKSSQNQFPRGGKIHRSFPADATFRNNAPAAGFKNKSACRLESSPAPSRRIVTQVKGVEFPNSTCFSNRLTLGTKVAAQSSQLEIKLGWTPRDVYIREDH